ncbi:MAG TPA: hypothetical protein VGS13_01345 [Stellaceae bacterium]|nr:hypothetical protein [Stellaceae bacterium]
MAIDVLGDKKAAVAPAALRKKLRRCTCNPGVIASAAKQSRAGNPRLD